MSEKHRVLIVDDDPLNVDYLVQELDDLGCDTIGAANGQEALQLVASESPDVILLDIMMPGMDGFEVLTHLQANQLWRDIPVIITSALSDMDNIVHGIELGAVDYLTKPINVVLLKARLTSSLEKKKLRDVEKAELHLAGIVQRTLLPKKVPAHTEWVTECYYQPARALGGDFYDFHEFDNGTIGLAIGDVTDKGTPAALVMAATLAALRSVAEQVDSPGKLLERVNALLIPDVPTNMFVTCFYAVLDPTNGELRFANAGHDMPYHQTPNGVQELRATGMPLGLMPDSIYEESVSKVARGDTILLYSDGLVEARNASGEMFGFQRLKALAGADSQIAVQVLLEQLANFAGDRWEQEDDVTLVTLSRLPEPATHGVSDQQWRSLAVFSVDSKPGNERTAADHVATVVAPLDLSRRRLERLHTAVAEATMNAMEHGNRFEEEKPVQIEIEMTKQALRVRIKDQGNASLFKLDTLEQPNLDAKLEGLQSPRGWGLLLIKTMVDEMNVLQDDGQSTIELVLYLDNEEEWQAPGKQED